jgi:hypothetical protein
MSNDRPSTEQGRVVAERGREVAEHGRQEGENRREDVEEDRASAEASRKMSEQFRALARIGSISNIRPDISRRDRQGFAHHQRRLLFSHVRQRRLAMSE